ncbi:hypothetical protein GCM10009716_36080 [Streptomyces sodiiphilus]|uniref:DUF86 domain-containing protein n=1 Tax=Streptomyces sodiiphilus TaxID=226217 RepID=A0ABN2PP97_9ACTN
MTRSQPGSAGQEPLDARTRRTLHDFLDFAATAARLVARGREAYDGDEMLRLSGEAILHRIGEAVARLDDDFTTAHPGVRWRAMKGMRNLVAHDYGAVDHGILWNAMAHNLPQEAARVQRILDENP